jgi:hypothetical protein
MEEKSSHAGCRIRFFIKKKMHVGLEKKKDHKKKDRDHIERISVQRVCDDVPSIVRLMKLRSLGVPSSPCTKMIKCLGPWGKARTSSCTPCRADASPRGKGDLKRA